MEIKVFAKSDLALKGLTEHYNETRKVRHRVGLRAFGVKHVLDGTVLTINLKGLVRSILKKGGSVGSLSEQIKSDFLKDLDKSMVDVGATPEQYEVVFNE